MSVCSSAGRVRLKNLGDTCYLNSVLLQLFAIEPFRNVVLGQPPDDAYLRELSSLFLLMSESNA
jgi:ubiquitin C-terminal hydrolase